jgi:hypothetical protein
MRIRLLLCAFLWLFVSAGGPAATCAANADESRIQPYAKNSYYWQYQGKPLLLLGGSVDDNLFQIPNLEEHLGRIRAAGGNYVRNTMSWRDEGNVPPFAKRGDRHDLDRWNEEFWSRFERFLAQAAERDVIVQIEVWATFDYYRDLWARNPFNPKNNVNYTPEESGLPVRVDSHPVRTGNDFFRSVPKAKNLPVVLEYQRRFVQKILSYSLKHDHVLYCMDNETSVTPHWGEYWARLIREEADRAGKAVETTEMWDPWELDHAMHSATFDHPEGYTFVDISQNNHQKGQKHYDNALRRRLSIRKNPRPMTNVKIYGADGGRFGDTRDGVERFWRNIFGGHAAVRFHRPDSGIGLSPLAQRMIRSAREVTGAFDVFSSEPRPELLGDRDANEAYCLANAGRQYAVYFPRAGDVTLNTKGARGKRVVRWYAIDQGRWRAPEHVPAEGALRLNTPGDGQWAAIVEVDGRD